MASFSTIPEETPLLDAERPKQRKFAATTVAVLCLASAAVAASVPATYRAMTLDSTSNTWKNDLASFKLKDTQSCLGVKNHNKATVGSPLVIYTCDSKHIGQQFLYEQWLSGQEMGHIKYQTTAGDWLCVTTCGDGAPLC